MDQYQEDSAETGEQMGAEMGGKARRARAQTCRICGLDSGVWLLCETHRRLGALRNDVQLGLRSDWPAHFPHRMTHAEMATEQAFAICPNLRGAPKDRPRGDMTTAERFLASASHGWRLFCEQNG